MPYRKNYGDSRDTAADNRHEEACPQGNVVLPHLSRTAFRYGYVGKTDSDPQCEDVQQDATYPGNRLGPLRCPLTDRFRARCLVLGTSGNWCTAPSAAAGRAHLRPALNAPHPATPLDRYGA